MMRRQYSGVSSRNGVIAVQPTVETTRSTVPSAVGRLAQQPVAAVGSVASQPSVPSVSTLLVLGREILDRCRVEVGGDRADAAAGEQLGDGAADARAGADHQCGTGLRLGFSHEVFLS